MWPEQFAPEKELFGKSGNRAVQEFAFERFRRSNNGSRGHDLS